MANSNRRYIDHNGNQFMPMNVEGGAWNEEFISSKKLVVLVCILLAFVVIIMTLIDSYVPFFKAVSYFLIWGVVSSFALRYIVFEERFYYKMYKVLKKYEYTTPAMFWEIATIRDTSDGAIITYSDTKIGVLLKIERDTITGKHPDFQENHYDAISDFYKALVKMRYSFVQLNVMEKAGNDPRLDNLDHLIHKSDNENICKLMEKEIGYIKSITHNTLYESDYILVFTGDITKVDNIISDVIDCVYKLMDGAYIGYSILSSRDIVELVKEQYGVRYFNYTQATLEKYRMKGASTNKPFTLFGIEYADGEIQELDNSQRNKVYSMTSEVLAGTRNMDSISIKQALAKKERKDIISGVDFETLGQGFHGVDSTMDNRVRNNPIRGGIRKPPVGKPKNKKPAEEVDNNFAEEYLDF